MEQPDPTDPLVAENADLRRRLADLAARLEVSLQTLAALPSALVRLDRHGTITAVNPAGAALTSLLQKAGGSAALRDLSPPAAFAAGLAQLAQQARATGRPARGELAGPEPGGHQHYEITAVPEHDTAGAIVGVLLETHNVSERKRLQEELQLAEARFRVAATLSTDSIYEVDLRTGEVHIYSGDKYREQGLRVETLDIAQWEAALHPEDRERVLAGRQRLIDEGTPFIDEYRFLLSNTDVLYLADRSVLVELPGTHQRRQIGVTTDITGRKRLEETLRFQAQVLDVVGQAVIVTDLSGMISYVNHAAERIYGWTQAEVVGRSIVSMVSAEHRAQGEAILAALSLVSGPQSGELMMQRRDGTSFPAAITVVPVFDSAGRPIALAGASLDMTDRARRETERLALERRLQESQRLESLVAMAGGIAHDYNNILMAILGHAELALDEAAPGSELHQGLSAIIAGARRAADLAGQMLAYSGRGSVLTQSTDLTELIEGMRGLLHATLKPGLALTHNLSVGLPPVAGNPVQLRQVILNLVTNAVEASAAGEITIATLLEALSREQLDELLFGTERQPGWYVRLTVVDQGHGMDAATLGRIFDPFFSTRFVGRGLGLAVVHGVVRGHRGVMQVQSGVGQGTAFHLWLPVHTVEPASLATGPRVNTAATQLTGVVLVIDDEPAVRGVLRRMLERLGLEVREAADGPTGLVLLEELGDDLQAVLVDLNMPNMAGSVVAEAVAARRPETPVVLMSGYSAEEVLRQHGHIPLAGVLQKPFSNNDVRRLLERVLQ